MQHPVHVRLAVRTALVLQHLAHVRLAVRASNHIDPPVNPTHCQKTRTSIHQPRPTSATRNDRPAANIYDSTNINYPQRSSSCTHLRRPTSATRNDRPAAHIYDDQHQLPATIVQLLLFDSTIPATDTNQRHNYHELYALVKTTINCHLCYNCYVSFVSFIVFWLSLLARLT